MTSVYSTLFYEALDELFGMSSDVREKGMSIDIMTNLPFDANARSRPELLGAPSPLREIFERMTPLVHANPDLPSNHPMHKRLKLRVSYEDFEVLATHLRGHRGFDKSNLVNHIASDIRADNTYAIIPLSSDYTKSGDDHFSKLISSNAFPTGHPVSFAYKSDVEESHLRMTRTQYEQLRDIWHKHKGITPAEAYLAGFAAAEGTSVPVSIPTQTVSRTDAIRAVNDIFGDTDNEALKKLLTHTIVHIPSGTPYDPHASTAGMNPISPDQLRLFSNEAQRAIFTISARRQDNQIHYYMPHDAQNKLRKHLDEVHHNSEVLHHINDVFGRNAHHFMIPFTDTLETQKALTTLNAYFHFDPAYGPQQHQGKTYLDLSNKDFTTLIEFWQTQARTELKDVTALEGFSVAEDDPEGFYSAQRPPELMQKPPAPSMPRKKPETEKPTPTVEPEGSKVVKISDYFGRGKNR